MIPRHLPDVIDQVIEVSTNEEMNKALLKVKKDASYTAPELMYMRWNQLSEVLFEYIPHPTESDETVKICSIVSTMSEEDVRKEYSDANSKYQ